MDEEAAIRTNTTICLGKIATHIDAGTREKVLIAAFVRALKDPFPPARNAALLREQQDLLLTRGGASCVIAGCTEIPLVLEDGPELLNPTQVLADHIIWRTLRDRS